MMAVNVPGIALQTGDGRDSHARGKEWILAVGLFRASPARITGNVEHGRKDLADSGRSRLIACGSEYLVNQIRVPSAGEAQRLRKAGTAVFHKSVKGFAHEEIRNAEPRFLLQITLHAVAQDRCFAGREDEVGIVPASHHLAGR